MAWQLLVIRKDSPMRHQLAAAGIADSAEKCNIVNSPALAGLKLNNWWWDSDGAVHADMGQLRMLVGGFVKAFMEHPKFLLDLAERYRGVAEGWLKTMEGIGDRDLSNCTETKLLAMFDAFCEGAIESNTMLMPPFAVERLQEGDAFKRLLGRLADQVMQKLEEETQMTKGAFMSFFYDHLTDTRGQRENVINRIADIVQFTTERTFTEQRDLELTRIAADITEDRSVLELYDSQDKVAEEDVKKASPQIYERIQRALQDYAWIKQWGYPPFYSPATFDDFLSELRTRVGEDPAEQLLVRLDKPAHDQARFEEFAEHIPISERDMALVHTVNEYNFLRTWRMEVVMKAQHLSLPLLREIERRGIDEGKMAKDDIFLMMAPEIRRYLEEGAVPGDLAERREGWVMTDRDGDVSIFAGDACKRQRERFYSVIDHRERARGAYGHEAAFVGAKAENLFRLRDGGISVPEFFVVTTYAYRTFLERYQLGTRLEELFNGLDMPALISKASESADKGYAEELVSRLNEFENEVKSLFIPHEMPDTIREGIDHQFTELGLAEVAVRSSATVEDSTTLSWAGRFNSFVYVCEDDIPSRVKDVWASLYARLAMQYAIQSEVSLLNEQMGVIVQEMVDPGTSGVVNTALAQEAKDLMEIEAVYGQCSPLASGDITPDRYIVRKDEPFRIIERSVVSQKRKYCREGWCDIAPRKQGQQKIPDAMVAKLASLCRTIEDLYEKPQDIEWASVNEEILVVQARPQTAIEVRGVTEAPEWAERELILTGQKGRVAALASGTARVVEKLTEASKLSSGEILVLRAATPDWDPLLMRAAAIITNEGGSTSHAIRVANERRLPAVVGTGKATKIVNDGDILLVDTTDPFKGKIYRLQSSK